MDTDKLIAKVLDSEKMAYNVYSGLYGIETDRKLKKKFKELIDLDVVHIKIWEDVVSKMNISAIRRSHSFDTIMMKLVRRLFGKGLTISVLNSLENKKISDLSKVFPHIPDKYKPDIVDYLVEEMYQERLIQKDSIQGGVLKNIRDVVFGMNDGLVEVLAAVSGFTGILHNNLLIFAAGGIVGLSGTISMAVGAYLSSKSERDVENDSLSRLELEVQVAKERLVEDLKEHSESYRRLDQSIDKLIEKLKSFKDPVYKILEKERDNPLMKFLKGSGKIYEKSGTGVEPVKDAAYVGAFYILGAVIPLISFLIGIVTHINPYINLAISVVLTAVAISIISSIIAINSNEKTGKYVIQYLGLSLGAALVTFIVGYAASTYLHVAV